MTKCLIGVVTTCILIYLAIRHLNMIAMGISWLINILFPILLGVFMAFILNVPMRSIEKHLRLKQEKAKRPLAIFLSLLFLSGIFTGIAFLVIPKLEGNLIYPKVVGSRVNLPAIWVLAAVTVGGNLSGPVGMLLGVPAASAIYELLREATAKRELKRNSRNRTDWRNPMKPQKNKRIITFLKALPLMICIIFIVLFLASGDDVTVQTVLIYTPESPFTAAIVILLLYALKSVSFVFPSCCARSVFCPEMRSAYISAPPGSPFPVIWRAV